jgi:hypothetical protein
MYEENQPVNGIVARVHSSGLRAQGQGFVRSSRVEGDCRSGDGVKGALDCAREMMNTVQCAVSVPSSSCASIWCQSAWWAAI